MKTSFDDLPAVIGAPLGAELLGISQQTFRALCRSGELPAVHIGRRWVVPKSRLVAFLEGGEQGE